MYICFHAIKCSGVVVVLFGSVFVGGEGGMRLWEERENSREGDRSRSDGRLGTEPLLVLESRYLVL